MDGKDSAINLLFPKKVLKPNKLEPSVIPDLAQLGVQTALRGWDLKPFVGADEGPCGEPETPPRFERRLALPPRNGRPLRHHRGVLGSGRRGEALGILRHGTDQVIPEDEPSFIIRTTRVSLNFCMKLQCIWCIEIRKILAVWATGRVTSLSTPTWDASFQLHILYFRSREQHNISSMMRFTIT